MIECMGCGRKYNEENVEQCKGCTLLVKGCGRSRCPYCGYENQLPLKKAFKGLRERCKEFFNGSRD